MRVVKPNPFGVLNEQRLKRFERVLGCRLPDEYREFLLLYNGGRWGDRVFDISKEEGESEVHHVYGLHDGPDYCRLDHVFSIFRTRIPSFLLPIADDPGGNKICLGIRGDSIGEVFFWVHDRGESKGDSDNVIQIGNSLGDFVSKLKSQSSGANLSSLEKIIDADDQQALAELVEAARLISKVKMNTEEP